MAIPFSPKSLQKQGQARTTVTWRLPVSAASGPPCEKKKACAGRSLHRPSFLRQHSFMARI